MRRTLVRHPDFPCEAVGAIEVEASRPRGRELMLRYRLVNVTEALVIPRPSEGRTDGLWKHTCFEAFVQAPPRPEYRELNLSPGGAWAAYRFDGYRAGMAQAGVPAPRVEAGGPARDGFATTVTWALDLPADAAWRVGVAAVVEESGGRIAYWALQHPGGRPDFHHPDCFALELPAPDRS
jgi:hypothetical protein